MLVINPEERLGADKMDSLYAHAFFDEVRTTQHWTRPLIIPPKCVDFFSVRIPQLQRLCSMTNFNFFSLKNIESPLNINDLQITSKTISPSITPDYSPSDKKHQINNIRESDESTNINTSGGR